MTEGHKWLLLVYKIPPEPSRYRVAVWRRLKGAGAVYLQNSVCVLPDSEANRDLFGAVAREIEAAGGESLMFLAEASDPAEQERVVARFNSERDAEYGEFLEQCAAFLEEIRRETERRNFTFGELEENDENLERLRGWLGKIEGRDFFGAARAQEARARLGECREALEAFAARIYAASEGQEVAGGRAPG
ncbi:MAG: Chromate resistance protein ChrB [Bacillota bacterium]